MVMITMQMITRDDHGNLGIALYIYFWLFGSVIKGSGDRLILNGFMTDHVKIIQ